MSYFAFTSVHNRIVHVKGALSFLEGKFLYDAAGSGTDRGVIVEIGSFYGRSTIYLASGSKALGKGRIYAIDPHTGGQVLAGEFSPPTYRSFIANLNFARVRDYVKPIKTFSWKAATEWAKPIQLLFIDGNHSYKSVNKDIQDWEPFVISNGIIAFHDVLNPEPGPARAILKLLWNSRKFSDAGFADSIFYILKHKPTVWQFIKIRFFSAVLAFILMNLLLAKNIPFKKGQRFIQQYLIKRWLKYFLTSITSRAYRRIMFRYRSLK